MYNYGYIMVDCGGLELTSASTVTITGLYDRITAAMKTGKLIVAANVKFEDAPMSPIVTFINKRPSGNYIATASTLQIEVDSEDGVTIHNMIV